MSNKIQKPLMTAQALVEEMKKKGITFHYTQEDQAADYLTNRNNYLRTAAYRKNYQKYTAGVHKGKYINLDFAYLQELSTIDMHLRFLISKMCLDIEHDLKVHMLKDIESDPSTDGYDIVQSFLSQNSYIIGKLEATSHSPFTGDLISKYFTLQEQYNPITQRNENKIISFNDCPCWVLLEIMTFGDFLRFYQFYYTSRNLPYLDFNMINLVKSLRNGAAHNNCILVNLEHSTSRAPGKISRAISKIPEISSNQRIKKLSCRPILEFTTLLYVYKQVVSEKVQYHRTQELKELFFVRIPEKQGFFLKNELIVSSYHFACHVIQAFW